MVVKGQKINDRYEIIRLIGEGGMANVYLAEDTILERKVAVKILRGDLANDEKFVKKFQREAISASSLSHPNIVEMYDVGEDDGEYYIVMEYVEGKTLKSLIKKRGGLTLSEVVDIMLQLTGAISCAHDSYIIHRDIKPQNVLIMDNGCVKITDFGIAQALNSAEMTQTNSVMGTVHYLPPEQANGTGATKKSDIYSLGILMYELLIGKLPFKGDNAVEIALKQMKEPIPSVCDEKEDVPQSIENIIIKATAKNPKNRYESVNDMHEDLKTALSRERKDEEKIKFSYPEYENSNEALRERRSRLDKVSELMEDEEEPKSKAPFIIAGIILFLLVVGVSIFVMMNLFKTPDIKVPNVSGMTIEEAESILKEEGFIIATDDVEEYSDKVLEGNVIKTDPKAGRSVKKGYTVTLYISKGIEGFAAEKYVGQNYLTVKAALEGKGITVKTEEEEHTKDDGTKENIILKQDVEEGTMIKTGDTITFTIPKFITTYPDFVKEIATVEEVEKFCKENNVTLVKKEKESSTEPEGTIIYQSQPAGKKVVAGVTLTITITKKPVVTEPEVNDETTNQDTTNAPDTNQGTTNQDSTSQSTTTDNNTTTSTTTSGNTTTSGS